MNTTSNSTSPITGLFLKSAPLEKRPGEEKKMKTKRLTTLTLVGLMMTGLTAGAQSPNMKMTTAIPEEIITPDKVETRLGTLSAKYGMPDQASIDKVYDQLDFARTVEVFLNTQGGLSLYSFRKGMRDIGVSDHTLMTAETMTDSTGMFLTPNTVTPQTYTFLNLAKGPVVMEVPHNILGVVDDMWFRYVADIGLLGPDRGKGGKYLFVPPHYKGNLPESGYFVFKPATYGLFVGFRNFAVKGDVKLAIASMRQHTRIYPLSEAGAPHKELPNKNTSFAQINTVQPNTYLYWEYLNKLIQEEPAGAIGPEITGQIAAIGIEKGKPFLPDARMKKILEEGVAVGNIQRGRSLLIPETTLHISTERNRPGIRRIMAGTLLNPMAAESLTDGPPSYISPPESRRPWRRRWLVKDRSMRLPLRIPKATGLMAARLIS